MVSVPRLPFPQAFGVCGREGIARAHRALIGVPGERKTPLCSRVTGWDGAEMGSFPCLVRLVSGSGQVRYRLGERLVDRYLEFVAGRDDIRAVRF
jgi:hypothetical protein